LNASVRQYYRVTTWQDWVLTSVEYVRATVSPSFCCCRLKKRLLETWEVESDHTICNPIQESLTSSLYRTVINPSMDQRKVCAAISLFAAQSLNPVIKLIKIHLQESRHLP